MSEIWQSVVLLAVGLVMIYYGANWLINGSVAIAKKLNISHLIIGLTIVAFGTSTPELTVSLSAALNGYNDVTIGNVVGSNIANIGLILGIAAILTPLVVSKTTIRREVPIMIIVSILVIPLSLDNVISQMEGMAMIAGVVLFTVFSYKQSKKEKKTDLPLETITEEKVVSFKKSIFFIAIGSVFLIVSSFITVDNAVIIAESFGVPNLIIGITLLAVGTSLPELITTVMAIKKGHVDLSVGNIIGSNIFNVLAIAGVSATITGIVVNPEIIRDYVIMIVFSLGLIPIMRSGLSISKYEGVLLLGGYIAYAVFLFYTLV